MLVMMVNMIVCDFLFDLDWLYFFDFLFDNLLLPNYERLVVMMNLCQLCVMVFVMRFFDGNVNDDLLLSIIPAMGEYCRRLVWGGFEFGGKQITLRPMNRSPAKRRGTQPRTASEKRRYQTTEAIRSIHENLWWSTVVKVTLVRFKSAPQRFHTNDTTQMAQPVKSTISHLPKFLIPF